MKAKNIKVIFDTNVWISFLIGKRLAFIKNYISSGQITIVTTVKKYFPQESVTELLELLETIAEKVEIKPTHFINRDPKDNFLLDLIDFSKADYLVTGDKDLLVHNPFKSATILTPANFEIALTNE
jgi:putative PIN family toxin of toxin-antitoxin system